MKNKNDPHKGSVWYHNPETKKSIRLYYGEVVPEGFIRGRLLYPSYPFMGNRLNKEALALHREIMKPYREEWLRRMKYGKYSDKRTQRCKQGD